MLVVICSNKFNKYCEKWFDIANKNKNFQFILINDDERLCIENNFLLNNLTIVNNSKNIGKIKSIIKYILDNYINDWIMALDDKDVLLNENLDQSLFKSSLKDSELIYVSDTMSINKNIIGNEFIDKSTLKNFYINKGKIGDKVIIFNSKDILENREEYEKFLSYPCKIYETALFSKYFDKKAIKIDPLVIHPYNKDGITCNNLNNKLENYQFYLWETEYYLNNRPSFNVLISRLFILWFLRKKGTINLKPLHKFLYKFIEILGLFPLIKKIYLYKLKKVINN